MPKVKTLVAFSADEAAKAKVFLAAQVASMMGRKLEEGDWSAVYCRAKGIVEAGWSNLHIDVNFDGLGVEQKVLRCAGLNGKPIKSVCGTTLMHPSATRSIRIDDVNADPHVVMEDVFRQYAELIAARAEKVRENSKRNKVDMRTGWLLWEDSLAEFLYFEEPMLPPDASKFTALWNDTPTRGARKASRSLWIFERSTGQKRYSVTTSAGIKIQPYFDVPSPTDPNLYYFRVQSEPIDFDTVQIWVTESTAHALQRKIGKLTKQNVSATVIKLHRDGNLRAVAEAVEEHRACPIPMSREAHGAFMGIKGVSDEHRAQLLLQILDL